MVIGRATCNEMVTRSTRICRCVFVEVKLGRKSYCKRITKPFSGANECLSNLLVMALLQLFKSRMHTVNQNFFLTVYRRKCPSKVMPSSDNQEFFIGVHILQEKLSAQFWHTETRCLVPESTSWSPIYLQGIPVSPLL